VAGNTLRIVTVDNLGAMFNQTVFPLRYTPRKMCRIPNTKQLVIVETDHNEFNEAERAALAASSSSSVPPSEGKGSH
jgi:splicing factor 3B subunit 3